MIVHDNDTIDDRRLGRTTLTNLAGDWELVSIDGTVITPEVSSRPPTMTVNRDGTINGFAGVNRYFGALDLEKLREGVFDVGGMGATKMAGSPQRMLVETHFLELLDTVDHAALADEGLQLSRDDRPVLIFKRTATTTR